MTNITVLTRQSETANTRQGTAGHPHSSHNTQNILLNNEVELRKKNQIEKSIFFWFLLKFNQI